MVGMGGIGRRGVIGVHIVVEGKGVFEGKRGTKTMTTGEIQRGVKQGVVEGRYTF